MTTYKLTYFNIMGLGETIRYMLSYLGKDFEDFRITDYPSWINEHKPKMPFEKIPLLEFDGHRLHQSMAICRYFAKEAKLNGDNAWEELQIDMIMDSFVDFRHSVWSYFYNRDENNKEHLKATLFNKTVPLYLGKFDKLLEEQGYLANGKTGAVGVDTEVMATWSINRGVTIIAEEVAFETVSSGGPVGILVQISCNMSFLKD
ncbi:glutathione S-transferase isoform X2 [Halyomorpha halys]|uniref:glutathione S-transferase isoform X2 n=1 Tax=Halyomorpha halys TaxID=286706 RepID=UPI0034D295DE